MQVLKGVAILAAAVVLVALAALSYRAWRQYENAVAWTIVAPPGIDEAAYLSIGGIGQWVHIRGEDRENPVVLILHGGPGGSFSALTPVFRDWEKHFTVVQWDQRGSGKTLSRGGEDGQGEMTIPRMADDGIELAEYLRTRLGKKKIAIIALSWGTVIGVEMARLRPDLFSAYVGTGQVVDKAGRERLIYDDLLTKAQAAGNEDALRELQAISAPPYDTYDDLLVERKWSLRYDTEAERALEGEMTPVVLFSPYYSISDIRALLAGPKYSGRRTHVEMRAYDARISTPRLELPFFVFAGDKDVVTPLGLARDYFDMLEAPHKEFVVLEGGGHAALLTMPDVFLRELLARVRPLALEAESASSTPR